MQAPGSREGSCKTSKWCWSQPGSPEKKGCSIQEGAGGTGPQSPPLCCAAQGGWAGQGQANIPLPSDAESGRQTHRPAQHREASGGPCPSLVTHTAGAARQAAPGGGPSGDEGLELLGSSGEREAEADNPENKKPRLAP